MGELREGMRRRDKCSFGYSPRGVTCAEKQDVVESFDLQYACGPFDPFPLERGPIAAHETPIPVPVCWGP